MIKYLELTAPESNQFRQAKILSIEVSEGDYVNIGDTLFKVQSGKKEIDLPTTLAGRITEIIATTGENISVMTPLVLLETEVAKSTATLPTDETTSENLATPKQTKKVSNNKKKIKKT